MDGTKRANVQIGSRVFVVQKQDQRTGKLTGVYPGFPTKAVISGHLKAYIR